MRIPEGLRRLLLRRVERMMTSRPPDFVIGRGPIDEAYLLRWYVGGVRAKYGLGGYGHLFKRSDEDEALHDHPWWFFSFVLSCGYWEVLPKFADGRCDAFKRVWRRPGTVVFHRAADAHRIEMPEGYGNGHTDPCISLVIRGGDRRRWGFYCKQGWVDFKEFLSRKDIGGLGCGEV